MRLLENVPFWIGLIKMAEIIDFDDYGMNTRKLEIDGHTIFIEYDITDFDDMPVDFVYMKVMIDNLFTFSAKLDVYSAFTRRQSYHIKMPDHDQVFAFAHFQESSIEKTSAITQVDMEDILVSLALRIEHAV